MRGRARAAVVAAALSTALAITAIGAPVASAAGGSISGTVTKFGTSTPIQGVEVCAYSEGGEAEEFELHSFCATTDVDGNYTISGLAENAYLLLFRAAELNYQAQYYKETSEFSKAELLQVTGTALTGKDAHLHEGGRISGRVTDSQTHLGITGGTVCAEQSAAPYAWACTSTEADGEYVIGGLPTGSYVVEFYGGSAGYLFQFYDGVSHYGEAEHVPVAVGETTEGIDAALDLGASISGRVTAKGSGASLPDVGVCLYEGGELWACEATEAGGTYEFSGLPSGSYEVSFNERPSELIDSDYLPQSWEGKSSLAEATTISLTAPEVRTGIDAQLLLPSEKTPQESHETSPPPPVSSGETGPGLPKCKKGFRRKMARGKLRCVRKRHHKAHHHMNHHR